MKSKQFLSILTILMLALGVSCEKKETTIPPPFAGFATSDNVLYYFVLNSPNSEFKIPVGTSDISNVSRTVNFSVSSTTGAQEGVQYSIASKSVVIPAGEAIDTISFRGIFDQLPLGRIDTLVFTITGGDAPISTYAKEVKVVMRRFCDVVLSNLEGEYATYEGSYGPYPSVVSDAVSTGQTTATALIDNIYDSGLFAEVEFDWSDPGNLIVRIPDQEVGTTSTGLTIRLRENPSLPSSFQSCNSTITLNLQLYTSAGIIDTWTSSMSK